MTTSSVQPRGRPVTRLAFVVSVALAVFVSPQLGCDRSGCHDEIRNRLVSPGGDLAAGVIVANCGATTGYYTFVVVQSAKHGLQVDRDSAAVVAPGIHDVPISWNDNRTFSVKLPGVALLDRKDVIGDVRVVFR
jgi:hypothetical protein